MNVPKHKPLGKSHALLDRLQHGTVPLSMPLIDGAVCLRLSREQAKAADTAQPFEVTIGDVADSLLGAVKTVRVARKTGQQFNARPHVVDAVITYNPDWQMWLPSDQTAQSIWLPNADKRHNADRLSAFWTFMGKVAEKAGGKQYKDAAK